MNAKKGSLGRTAKPSAKVGAATLAICTETAMLVHQVTEIVFVSKIRILGIGAATTVGNALQIIMDPSANNPVPVF